MTTTWPQPGAAAGPVCPLNDTHFRSSTTYQQPVDNYINIYYSYISGDSLTTCTLLTVKSYRKNEVMSMKNFRSSSTMIGQIPEGLEFEKAKDYVGE